MSDKNEGLNERLAHRKRIQRMKTGLVLFIVTWMFAWMLISIALIVKVNSLQEQIDIITKNTIRSQQVEQKENQAGKDGSISQADGQMSKEQSSDKDSDSAAVSAMGGENSGYIRMSADHIKKAGEADGEKDAGEKKDREETESIKEADSTDDTNDTEDDKKAEEVKKVYLTFDDGPSKNTEKILDTLDEYHITATFFVTGRDDEESLERYRQIAERGHTIGMHSYSHVYEDIYESAEKFELDLDRIQKTIENATGIKCMLYRFPGGSSNQVSSVEMSEFIRILNKREITYFDWNAECGDASNVPYTAKEMVANVMKDVVKYHTSVVLMHDAENKQETLKALPMIIKKLQKMDAQLLPIDEDTTVVQHISADRVND